ncbi:C1 family peptidase [Kinneretia aquatilis]|uniref:C1 family peptidase n=1 Tax=Kinneretia aquatilis TaxID=2070761 RepID=UPI000D52A539|nr:C1 family peptidase [Paucibacter aquatile]
MAQPAIKATKKQEPKLSKSTARRAAAAPSPQRRYNARPDTIDFRDRLYQASLVEVPSQLFLEDYLKHKVPVLNQGTEGACTGFALATVAHFLLRRRKVVPDKGQVSARMFYEMARRYDEWEGEDYDGSSARGAMKAWQKHGVCAEALWPSLAKPSAKSPGLTRERADDSALRPLGAYLRVNHRDLVAMHAALAEVGILYATSEVHAGWDEVGADGLIHPNEQLLGGHAFAIVAYDEHGFWLQNSWGPSWGRRGFGHISYADWLAHGSDVWVARLGVPVTTSQIAGAPATNTRSTASAQGALNQLRPHVINLGNDGKLDPRGELGMREADLQQLFRVDLRNTLKTWSRRRIVLHAHGGLVAADAALQRLAAYKKQLMPQEAYPLSFIWHSDYWTTLSHMLSELLRGRRTEGALDRSKDFLLDRLDDGLEPLARALTGKSAWSEMKENALAASRPGHGAALAAAEIHRLAQEFPDLEVHLVAHSAGSILGAPLLDLLSTGAHKVRSCTLWAPACTHTLFEAHYAPALEDGRLDAMTLYTLDDHHERADHCAHIYNKSLLYLVSNAFEDKPRPWFGADGEPILGLAKFLDRGRVAQLIASGRIHHVLAPNLAAGVDGSKASSHGAFDDDETTVSGSFARMLGATAPAPATRGQRSGPAQPATPPLAFERSAASLQAQRRALDALSRKL